MKRLTTATILSAFAALALVAGCKSSSSSAKKAEPGEQAAGGPLLLPHQDWPGAAGGAAGGSNGRRPGDVAARPDRPGGPDRQRGWGMDPNLTPEQMQARREEMQANREARRQEMMAQFDADHDGTLSDTERAAMREARVAEMVDRVDADHDGKVSKTELEDLSGRGHFPLPDFATLDTDHDGFLTAAELAKALPQGGPRGDRDYGGNRGQGGPDGAGDQAPPSPAPATK